MLPAVEGKVRRRPGPGKKTKQPIYVPDEKKYPKFWREWYQAVDETGLFQFPFPDAEEAVNPYFGYYGFRWHPTNHEPGSFHIGLDFSAPTKTDVGALADGVLEYSGFDLVNGNYVMVSHPAIEVEDGCRLQTLYMHLRSNVVKFTSYQKMLREISLHTYPEIEIKKEEVIGEVGDSGNVEGYEPRLHLQIQLQRKKGGVIALDPARLLGILPTPNLTETLSTEKEFHDFYNDHEEQIMKWGVQGYWDKKNKEV